ncbi:MerR family transcriptional regulator [Microbacteriaceae bacterium VKM Ac-2854]|nr:MerR family transcriptional regulator [Microbacteriaceae bacterium VKM Ac-2854]
MAWSTQQLARIAGTSVKTVRYYHQLGLLAEPERAANGYKQYQGAHLVRLLQIIRLTELGVPLAQISAMEEGGDDPRESLRLIDAELEATIGRLQRIRDELAVILSRGASADLPAGFREPAGGLPQSERSMLMVLSRVLDESAMRDLERMNDEPRTSVDDEFDALAPDADRETRRALAERIAPQLTALAEQYDWIGDAGSRSPRGAAFAQDAVGHSLQHVYNQAQLEVLYRAHLISTESAEKITELDAALDAAEGTAPPPH